MSRKRSETGRSGTGQVRAPEAIRPVEESWPLDLI